MKNAGMAGAVALVGIGLLSIGLSNFANRAEAVPSAVVNAGPDEPTIAQEEKPSGAPSCSRRRRVRLSGVRLQLEVLALASETNTPGRASAASTINTVHQFKYIIT